MTTTTSLASLNGSGSDVAGLDTSFDTGTDVSTGRKTSALTNKLSNVISSSFADTEIRDALRLLDLRTAAPTSVSTQPKSTQKVIRLTDKWDLKASAQKNVIDSNGQIVEDFGKVADQLRRVGELIRSLNQACDDMKKHILLAKQETRPVLEEAETLIGRKQETETKQQLLDAFCRHFLVSDEDLTLLSSSAAPLNDRFFAILERVKKVHQDCEILLGFENQRLGLELMEQTSRHLDAGYKKLYNSIQQDFRTLDLEDPRMSGSIRRALRTLSERPAMFQNCLNFFAEARQSALTESFQAALTGSNVGKSVAIEFSTHDPLRYIGDMLAWTHSAAISEKEGLEGFFISDAEEISKGLKAGQATEPWSRMDRIRPAKPKTLNNDQAIEDDSDEDDSSNAEDEEPVFDGRKALSDLIDRNLAGVCHTLQQRITITVRNNGDAVVTYKIFNLLNFYNGIFSKLLQPSAHITQTISQLESETLRQFEEIIEEEITSAAASTLPNPSTTPGIKLPTTATATTTDLTPPAFLSTTLKQFTDICRARGAQMTSSELERLFTAMITTSLNQCAELSTQRTIPRQIHIYRTNYLCLVRSCLRSLTSTVPSMTIPLEKATKEISFLRDQLVADLTSTFLEDSGVAPLLLQFDTIRSNLLPDQSVSIVLQGKNLDKLHSNLELSAAHLDEFLGAGLMDAQEQFKLLSDKSLAKEVVEEAIERFCGEFDELENAVVGLDEEMDLQLKQQEEDAEDSVPGETYRDIQGEDDEQRVRLRDLYPRTGAEVRALLS